MNDVHRALPASTDLIFRALARYPDRTAFTWDGRSLTYAAVAALMGRMQAAFFRSDVRPSSRIALVSSNRAESWCAGIAAQALGCPITWLHPLGSLQDHIEQMEDAEIDTMVVDAEKYAGRGADLCAMLPNLRNVFTIGRADFGLDLLEAADSMGEASPRLLAGPSSMANLGYTGGTTGKAKAAVRSQSTQAAITLSILADFDLPSTPRLLCVAPISHVGGTKIVPTLVRGGTVHLLQGFDPERVLSAIERERIDTTLLVPTMVYMLLDHPQLGRHDLSSLELLLYGGSPMSPARLVEGIERLGPVFSQLYGQAECYPIALLRREDHDPARPELFGSCGQPVSTCEVKLLDDDMQEVALGEAGEICVRAPQMMHGYWRQPELTATALEGGWLHTGDIARADERGYLYIVDRKKDMIVSGGFNVYPREIEDVLGEHQDVAMSAVVGLPDPKWGEAVTAFVVRRSNASVDAQALIDLVKRRKGSRQAPKQVVFVEQLPLTPVGKVDKKAVRAPYWASQKRQVA